jgi:hypothetical protein
MAIWLAEDDTKGLGAYIEDGDPNSKCEGGKSMKLTVKLDMDNEAFDTDMTEAGRILRKLADTLETGISSNPYDTPCNIRLMDVNGNSVGTAVIR